MGGGGGAAMFKESDGILRIVSVILVIIAYCLIAAGCYSIYGGIIYGHQSSNAARAEVKRTDEVAGPPGSPSPPAGPDEQQAQHDEYVRDVYGAMQLAHAYWAGLLSCMCISIILFLLQLIGLQHNALTIIDQIHHVCSAIFAIIIAICFWCYIKGTGGCLDQVIASTVFCAAFGVCCAIIASNSLKG